MFRLYNNHPQANVEHSSTLAYETCRHIANCKLCHFMINVVFVGGIMYHYILYIRPKTGCVDLSFSWYSPVTLHKRCCCITLK
jgi:hypothetical protein